MCSNYTERIAEIGQAIDDLAADALAAYTPAYSRPPRPDGPASLSDADQVVIRLAKLWTVLAELDPEVARRLPTYEA